MSVFSVLRQFFEVCEERRLPLLVLRGAMGQCLWLRCRVRVERGVLTLYVEPRPGVARDLQFHVKEDARLVVTYVGFPAGNAALSFNRGTLVRAARHHQEQGKLEPHWAGLLQALPDANEMAELPVYE